MPATVNVLPCNLKGPGWINLENVGKITIRCLASSAVDASVPGTLIAQAEK